jgi:hypothetical protein
MRPHHIIDEINNSGMQEKLIFFEYEKMAHLSESTKAFRHKNNIKY